MDLLVVFGLTLRATPRREPSPPPPADQDMERSCESVPTSTAGQSHRQHQIQDRGQQRRRLWLHTTRQPMLDAELVHAVAPADGAAPALAPYFAQPQHGTWGTAEVAVERKGLRGGSGGREGPKGLVGYASGFAQRAEAADSLAPSSAAAAAAARAAAAAVFETLQRLAYDDRQVRLSSCFQAVRTSFPFTVLLYESHPLPK
jgi:hypothetical protein